MAGHMNVMIKKTFLSHSVLIVCSAIIGYSLWFMLSRNQILNKTVNIPVMVFFKDGTLQLQTSVRAVVQGARYQLNLLERHPPRVTLYVEKPISTTIAIMPDDILLPDPLSVISYEPHEITVPATSA